MAATAAHRTAKKTDTPESLAGLGNSAAKKHDSLNETSAIQSKQPMNALEVHPVMLERLGKLPVSVARRMLKRWYNEIETQQLLEKAGCIDEPVSWSPYTEYENPFLIYGK